MKNYGLKLNNSKAYHSLKRNPDLILDKDALAEHVQSTFNESNNSTEFYKKLEEQGHETYLYQDNVKGIFWHDQATGTIKKMRFSRLGVEDEHLLALNRQDERLQEIENLRNKDYHQDLERYSNEEESVDTEEVIIEQNDIGPEKIDQGQNDAAQSQPDEVAQVNQPPMQNPEIDMGQQ